MRASDKEGERDIRLCDAFCLLEAYLDHLIVHSNSWEEHVRILQKLFVRLAKVQMTVNLAKSDFCKATVNYLGHNIGQGKGKPSDSKVQTIFQIQRTRKN